MGQRPHAPVHPPAAPPLLLALHGRRHEAGGVLPGVREQHAVAANRSAATGGRLAHLVGVAAVRRTVVFIAVLATQVASAGVSVVPSAVGRVARATAAARCPQHHVGPMVPVTGPA